MMKLRKKILLTAGLIGITTPIMAETSYQCLNCPAGTYSVAGATSCTKCPAGKYSTGGTSTCLSCPVGTYSKADATGCSPCPAGKYQNLSGQSSCKTCSDGTYSSSEGSTSCINIKNLVGTYVTRHCNSSSSGTLTPGWYRVSLFGGDGESYVGIGGYSGTAGGKGATLFYNFKITSNTSYSLYSNGGAYLKLNDKDTYIAGGGGGGGENGTSSTDDYDCGYNCEGGSAGGGGRGKYAGIAGGVLHEYGCGCDYADCRSSGFGSTSVNSYRGKGGYCGCTGNCDSYKGGDGGDGTSNMTSNVDNINILATTGNKACASLYKLLDL